MKFSSTNAVNLASLDEFGSFRSALGETLGRRLAVESLSFNDQFENLLFYPLEKANRPVLLVVDALDECDKAGRSDLLSVLLDKLTDLPMVKVMITSRPEPDIEERLRMASIVLCSDIQAGDDGDIHAKDICEYVSQTFAQSRRLQHLVDRAQVLANLAGGLFIWASTASRYLEDSPDPDADFSTIEGMKGLDEMYPRIIQGAIPPDGASFNAYCSVLQCILAAPRPLSVSEMQNLLKKGTVPLVVERLASVLGGGAGDRPVEILHPTFREYLTDRNRSGKYFININKGHYSFAIASLETMWLELKYDMCGVQTALLTAPFNNIVPRLDKLLEQAVSKVLSYSIHYWAYHVAECLEDRIVLEQLLKFFEIQLLKWVELMSWKGVAYHSTASLSCLQANLSSALASRDSGSKLVRSFTYWHRGH